MTQPARALAAAQRVPDRWRWVSLLVAAVGQAVALYLPGTHGPTTGLPLDKVAHFTMFAVVSALAVWAGIGWPWVALLMLAQAVASELAQMWLLDSRGGEVGDWLADVLGTCLGIAVGLALRRPVDQA